MTESFRVTPQGTQYEAPTGAVLDKRLRAADRPGEHLWVVTTAWACPDPERTMIEGAQVYLDAESLIMLGGPGCYKCERSYSRRLAKMPCRGSIDDIQPRGEI